MRIVSRIVDLNDKYLFIPGFLIIVVLLSNAFFPTYSFVIAAISLLISFFCIGNSIFNHKAFYYITIPFILTVFCGFFSSFILNSSLSNRDYFRDIFYLVQNVFFFLAGFSVFTMKSEKREILLTYIIISACLIVTYNLATLLVFRKFGFDNIRDSMLRGMETTMLSCFICFTRIVKKDRTLHKYRCIFPFIYTLFGFVFSFSRTGIILILFLLFISIIKTEKISLIIAGFSIVFVLLGVFIIATFVVDIPLLSYYCKKIVKSFNEINIFNDWTIGANRTYFWRGYESYSAIQEIKSGNLFSVIFGNGFGHSVKLEYAQPLGNKMYIDLPITHNAYLAIMVKYGILGTICVIASFISPFVLVSRRKDDMAIKTMTLSLLLYILISPLFVTSLLSSCTYGGIIFLYGGMIALSNKLPLMDRLKNKRVIRI